MEVLLQPGGGTSHASCHGDTLPTSRKYEQRTLLADIDVTTSKGAA